MLGQWALMPKLETRGEEEPGARPRRDRELSTKKLRVRQVVLVGNGC